MTDKQWKWAWVILSIPGVIGFFLPFTWGVSPFEAASNWPNDWGIGSLGLVMGLAFFVLVFHLRHASLIPLVRPEIIACLAFGIAGSLLIAGNSLYGLIKHGFGDDVRLFQIVALSFVIWVLPAAHVFIVLRYRRAFFTNSSAALAALMAGYLPNAGFCLTGFFGDWQIGAYFVLLACLCYIVMIVVTVRRLYRCTTRA